MEDLKVQDHTESCKGLRLDTVSRHERQQLSHVYCVMPQHCRVTREVGSFSIMGTIVDA